MVRTPHEEFVEVGLETQDIQQVRAVLELSRKYATRTPDINKIDNAKDTYMLLAPLEYYGPKRPSSRRNKATRTV